MGISVFYGPPTPQPPNPNADLSALLNRAYAIDQRFWDTADIYGDSENLLRDWFVANSGEEGG